MGRKAAIRDQDAVLAGGPACNSCISRPMAMGRASGGALARRTPCARSASFSTDLGGVGAVGC